MKVRWITLLVIILAMFGVMAMVATTANADGGVHSFSTTSVTSNCAGCHRAHTAIGSGLLKATSAYALCTSCHGVGASIDVVDGFDNSDGHPTRGSGFSYSSMNSGWVTPTVPVSTTVSSKHWVLGDPGYTGSITQTTVWGIGALNSGAGSTFTLQCSTCHDPHGKSGPGGAKTYRILRSDFSTTGPSGATGFYVPDTISHTYEINGPFSAYNIYYGQTYSSSNDTLGDNGNMTALNNWCGSCHTRIHTSDNTNTGASGPGYTSSGDSIFTYRHITTGTSTEFNFFTSNKTPSGPPGCMTCHVSHGSPAVVTSNSAKTVPWPGGTEGVNTPYGSYQDPALMRLNQRGVCEACHNK